MIITFRCLLYAGLIGCLFTVFYLLGVIPIITIDPASKVEMEKVEVI